MDFRNIEKETLANDYYRKVVYTTYINKDKNQGLQVVLMSLNPGEDIPEEIHENHVQFFRFEAGTGIVKVGRKIVHVKDGDEVVVPANKKHYVANTSKTSALKLYTIYTPPEHAPNRVNKRQPKI